MKVCVFCGSSHGHHPKYGAAAVALGKGLVERGWSLVYGGGRVGLMGTVANAVLEEGGSVTGVIPHFLNTREVAHEEVTHLELVDSMHERKARMEELSDAIVALPGGFGTYEELLEIITWGQLGLHRKPVGVLNLDGFYDPFLSQVQNGIDEGFIRPEFRSIFISAPTPEALLDGLAEYKRGGFVSFLDRQHT